MVLWNKYTEKEMRYAMNWLQSLIYGLISGLTEHLPVSSLAHQRILHSLFGVSQSDPICDLLVHLAVLFAVFFSAFCCAIRLLAWAFRSSSYLIASLIIFSTLFASSLASDCFFVSWALNSFCFVLKDCAYRLACFSSCLSWLYSFC